MTMTHDAPNERDDIEMLLPWYVTGKLSAVDEARVTAYLVANPEMQSQLEIIRQEQTETIAANEAIGQPARHSLDNLMAEINRREQLSLSGMTHRLVESVKGFFEMPTATGVRWAGAAAAVVLLMQALIIGALLGPSDKGASFQTASGGQQAAQGSFALVRFNPSASAENITRALGQAKLQIADGPKPGNIFKLKISDAQLNAAERDKRLAELRKMRGVFTLVLPAR